MDRDQAELLEYVNAFFDLSQAELLEIAERAGQKVGKMSAISALAEQSVDLIELQMVRIAELERELAYVARKADPLDPMERFRDDAHPAVTSARIAVHNAKIMAQGFPR